MPILKVLIPNRDFDELQSVLQFLKWIARQKVLIPNRDFDELQS